MNAMDLVKAFGYIDDDLVFDAIEGSAAPEPAPAAGRVKQPKPGKPPRGGAKTKAIIIGVVAVVLAAVIAVTVMYFTGVFSSKQVPIYQGMTISSADSGTSASAVAHRYNGDYTGRNDDVDKTSPFGSGALEGEVQSTLTVEGATESMYYATVNENIYITIKFSNPDYYDIISFVLTDGTTETHYTSYMFVDGSDYENIIIKLNVGSTPGITNYTISEIKYIDDNVNRDVIIGGDTVVSCGVRASNMVSASVTNEAVTLTSISFTATIADTYSLIEYSGGYVKAVLYDGESIIQTADLKVGTNEVKFTDLTHNTLYQYAIVACYDDLNGSGVALNYLYSGALYTPAVVLFDGIEVGQEGITFGYSWYEGYENTSITSLTLTHKGETTSLDVSETRITGLLSNNEYTLTATYIGVNNAAESISITFTTEEKATPAVEIEVTDETTSTLTFSVDFIDTDRVGEITAIALYNGDTLVQSETNLTQSEYIYSGLDAYTEYTLKVSYSYDLNDGVGTQYAEQTLSEHTVPLVQVQSMTVTNTSAVTEGGTIYITATVNNPSSVTYTSAVVNGVTYTNLSGSKGSTLYIDIINNGQFEGGTTTLTLTQITCTIDGRTYTIAVTDNNEASVFIYGTLTVESYTVVRLNGSEYEETYYGFPDEQLYYQIALNNETGYTLDSVTIENTTYTSSDITMSADKQTVYIDLDDDIIGDRSHDLLGSTLNSISYSYGEDVSKTSPANISAYYMRLESSETIEISSAEDLTTKINDNKRCYYVLTQNIDLSSYEWVNKGISIRGVFDGNGHTISGMGAKTTYENTDLNIGLFSEANAIITNLTVIAEYRITLNDTSTTSRSINIYGIGGLLFDNVTVDMSVVLTTNANISGISVGGLSIGGAESKNVTVNMDIAITTYGEIESIAIGGLSASGSGGDVENAEVTLKADVTIAGNYSVDSISIGGLIGSYSGGSNTVSNVAVDMDATITCTSAFSISVGGLIGSVWYATSNLDNISTDVTLNISSDLNYACGKYVAGDVGMYIDEATCIGTITVNET